MKKIEDITLADLQARVIEDGECMLWAGHANGGKHPQWRIGGKLYPARRVVYELTHGPILKKVQIGTRCGCDLCVHPDHLVARTRSTVQRGKPLALARKMKIASTKRAQSGRLTIDDVRAIRASTATGMELDAQYGLSSGYASRIRAGLVWVDRATPWAGLGARLAA